MTQYVVTRDGKYIGNNTSGSEVDDIDYARRYDDERAAEETVAFLDREFGEQWDVEEIDD